MNTYNFDITLLCSRDIIETIHYRTSVEKKDQ